MSIPKRPFFYRPAEFFDFGIAGEHPVEFIAWLDDCAPGEKIPVRIVAVFVKPTFKNPKDQEWNITEEIFKYPGRRERYEDEIRADYLSKREKDWEGDVA